MPGAPDDPETSAPELVEANEPARAAPAGDDEAEPSLRTLLTEETAALLLARAWSDETVTVLEPAGLAILWAHWALETGRGARMVGHNFAGLKGAGPTGGTVPLWTRERRENETVRVRRHFRAYRSPEDGAKDYVVLLRTRYPEAYRAVVRGHVNDFVSGLQRGGYFTDDPSVYLRAMRSLWSEFLEDADETATIRSTLP
jgi:hypothetical protein